MTIENLAKGAVAKGLDILGTGDATQPDWLKHLKKTLVQKDDTFAYDNTSFILTVEIEDQESIHHVVLLPSFESVENLRKQLRNDSLNLDHEWGGRPRVNLQAETIAGIVRDVGGLIGPAHVFTPFKAIFREGKYASISDCYRAEARNIHFLELGLSADSEIADQIKELHRLTYITSSDAHSPSPDKIGREFVRFKLDAPTFDELRYAILREKGRSATLNIGLHPKLGKYYLSFCSKCRRTLSVQKGNSPPSYDDLNIYMSYANQNDWLKILKDIHQRYLKCPADGKPLRLGVHDRATMIGKEHNGSPSHRPPYLHMPPLLELIALSVGVKSTKTKSAQNLYARMIEAFSTEIEILTETPTERIHKIDTKVSAMISAYRNGEIGYDAGGGGRYGSIIAPRMEI